MLPTIESLAAALAAGRTSSIALTTAALARATDPVDPQALPVSSATTAVDPFGAGPAGTPSTCRCGFPRSREAARRRSDARPGPVNPEVGQRRIGPPPSGQRRRRRPRSAAASITPTAPMGAGVPQMLRSSAE